MGELILPQPIVETGIQSYYVSSSHNNPVNWSPFIYTRTNNHVSLTGLINCYNQNSIADILSFNVPFVLTDWTNNNQLSGVVSVLNPHDYFTNPIGLNNVRLFNAIGTNMAYLSFNAQSQNNLIEFYFHMHYQIP